MRLAVEEFINNGGGSPISTQRARFVFGSRLVDIIPSSIAKLFRIRFQIFDKRVQH